MIKSYNFPIRPTVHWQNGYKIYADIMTGEKLLSIYVAKMELIYWLFHLSSRRRGDVVKGIVILASCEYHCIRVHEKLVQHPSNIISKDKI